MHSPSLTKECKALILIDLINCCIKIAFLKGFKGLTPFWGVLCGLVTLRWVTDLLWSMR